MNTTFIEITLVLSLAAVLGVTARALRQPTIIGYILAGVLVGPAGFLKLDNMATLDAFAQIGITLLLFLVGMEIRFNDLRHIGRPALLTGIGQIVFTTGIGYFITRMLGYGTVASLYISMALAFSSTIIVVKLLSEKKDLESLYGKIVIGFLLVQDFVALLALVVLTGLGGGETFSALGLAITLGKAMALSTLVIVVGKKVIPRVLHAFSRSEETLFLGSLAWGLGLAAIVTSPIIGFSVEIGGFLAGLALADSVEHFQISGRVKSLRDFFIVMFFVVLGSHLAIGDMGEAIGPALLLSLFVLIGNPLIVLIIMGALGYRARTAFLSSVTVAQISEFSLILVALGHRLGHIDQRTVAMVTTVAIITIVISSYMIIHSEKLYGWLRHHLKAFEFGGGTADAVGGGKAMRDHVVLIGCDRMGQNILAPLRAGKRDFVVVDFNPSVVARLSERGVDAVYGDIADPEIQEAVRFEHARLIISTVPSMDDSLHLLSVLRQKNPKAKVILTAEREHEAMTLYGEGANYVLLPHFIGGMQLARMIGSETGLRSLSTQRKADMAAILAR